MYTIKNTSSKIIHIGTTILMPDMTMKVNKTTAMTPAIQALAKREMLEVTAPVVEHPKQEDAQKQQAEQGDDGEKTGEAEESGEGQAPADNPKGARRTTRNAANAKE